MIIKLNIFSNKTSTVSVTLTVLSKSQNISENGSAFKKTEKIKMFLANIHLKQNTKNIQK